MQQTQNSVTLTCPMCSATFEFDSVGEYELVSCPACGSDSMTKQKGQRIVLEPFESDTPTARLHDAAALVIEL